MTFLYWIRVKISYFSSCYVIQLQYDCFAAIYDVWSESCWKYKKYNNNILHSHNCSQSTTWLTHADINVRGEARKILFIFIPPIILHPIVWKCYLYWWNNVLVLVNEPLCSRCIIMWRLGQDKWDFPFIIPCWLLGSTRYHLEIVLVTTLNM